MNPSESDPPLVELYNMLSGDTWRGIPLIGPVTVQEPGDLVAVQPSAALVSVSLNLTRTGAKSPSITFGTADVAGVDAPITIGNAVTWEITIPAVTPAVWTPVPGTYTGQVKTVDADGYVLSVYSLQLVVTENKNI